MPVIELRAAAFSDFPALEALIAASTRALGRGFYTDEEIEATVAHVDGVDTTLIADGGYLIASIGGGLAGCGGWSRRATLFGGDQYADRTPAWLDPSRDAARIRAFFVAPGQARQGVGTALLLTSEAAAAAAGFGRAALMATLPGVPFYTAHGYHAELPVTVDAGGVDVRSVPMSKSLLPQSNIFTETKHFSHSA